MPYVAKIQGLDPVIALNLRDIEREFRAFRLPAGFAATDPGKPTIPATDPLKLNLDGSNGPMTGPLGFALAGTAPVTEGQLSWNPVDHTLNIGMEDGVVQQVGQEFFVRAHNETGGLIPNGSAVRLTTALAPDGQIHIALADKTTAGGNIVIAIATMDIPSGEYGLCTKYGVVRGINTSMLTEGGKVYLSTGGGYSDSPGVWPDYKILLGYCIVSDATNGSIYVSVDNSHTLEVLHDVDVLGSPTAGSSLVFENGRWTGKNFADTSKEVTGFSDPSLITVTYNSASRTVTLTGTVLAYYHNLTVVPLVSGWTSPAHLTGRTATQYLYYDGSNFVWGDGIPWTFDMLQIAAVVISPAGVVISGIRECHSTLQWQAHKAFHQTVGCYLNAGGDIPPASYALLSYTAADRRPLVDATYLADEDLPSTLPALTTESYTRFNLTAANTMVFATAQTDIVSVTGAIPNWNQFNGSTWVQTPMIKDQYAAVFLMAMPVTADSGSQNLRYVWIQPQSVSTSLATIQGLSPGSVNLSGLATFNPELCYIGKVIILYNGPAANNWYLVSVEKLTGTKISQTAVVGNFLSSVSVDGTTILGNGTTSSPLSVGVIPQASVTNLVSDLALKAPLASPAFTGTVTGITKAMVGLGSVDNTADSAKNVLSATKLATARAINGVNFDGTAAITITAAPAISITSGNIPKSNGTTLVASNLSDSGTAITASVPIVQAVPSADSIQVVRGGSAKIASVQFQTNDSNTVVGSVGRPTGATNSLSLVANLEYLNLSAATAGKGISLQTGGVERLFISDTAITAIVPILFKTKTPASAGAAGVLGEITYDASYIYVCTATNTWKRVAIATW